MSTGIDFEGNETGTGTKNNFQIKIMTNENKGNWNPIWVSIAHVISSLGLVIFLLGFVLFLKMCHTDVDLGTVSRAWHGQLEYVDEEIEEEDYETESPR